MQFFIEIKAHYRWNSHYKHPQGANIWNASINYFPFLMICLKQISAHNCSTWSNPDLSDPEKSL